MKILANEMKPLKNGSPFTANLVINNYEPEAVLNFFDKMNKLCHTATLVRRSPIRFIVVYKNPGFMKRVMQELSPESAVLRLTYSLPQSRRVARLQTELLNYIETF